MTKHDVGVKYEVGDRVQVIDASQSAGAFQVHDVGVVVDNDLWEVGVFLEVDFGPNHPVKWADGSGRAAYVVSAKHVVLVEEAMDESEVDFD